MRRREPAPQTLEPATETEFDRLLKRPLVLSWMQEPEPTEPEDDWQHGSVCMMGVVCWHCKQPIPMMHGCWRSKDGRYLCGLPPASSWKVTMAANICPGGSPRGRHTHRATARALHGKTCR